MQYRNHQLADEQAGDGVRKSVGTDPVSMRTLDIMEETGCYFWSSLDLPLFCPQLETLWPQSCMLNRL